MNNNFLKSFLIFACMFLSQAIFSSAPAHNNPLFSLDKITYETETVGMLIDGKVITAYFNNNDIGSVGYSDGRGDQKPEVEALYVDAAYRKKGLATILLKKALSDIRGAHNKPVEICIEARPFDNKSFDVNGLVSFYKKHGAVILYYDAHCALMKFPALSGDNHA